MTETTDSTPTPVDIATSAPTSAPASPVPVSAPRFNWTAFFALLFAITACAVVGWRTFRDQTDSELTNYRQESAIRDQSLALSDLRQQLADLRADDRSGRQLLAAQIEAQHARIEAQQQTIATLTSIDRSDWELAEAEYLLQLANQRLLLGGDTKASLELLTAADTIMRELDDSGLLPVRQALAQDLAALKAVTPVDIDGVYLALSAAAEQAAALPLIQPPVIQLEPTAAPATPAEPQPLTWTERIGAGLAAALHKLDQLVQIRHRDEPYKSLLAPQYEAALRQNLALKFEQAEAALLAGNQKLYSTSLDKAQTWITTYFTLDEQATRAVAATVEELKARQIKPALPDVSTSRRALNAFIKSRRALQDDNSNMEAAP